MDAKLLLAEVFLSMKRYDSAKAYIRDYVEVEKNSISIDRQVDALELMASVHEELQEYEEQTALLEKAIQLRERYGFLRQIYYPYYLNGLSLRNQGRYEESIPLFFKALEAENKSNNLRMRADILSALSEAYELNGNTGHALVIKKMENNVLDSIFSTEREERVSNLLNNFE